MNIKNVLRTLKKSSGVGIYSKNGLHLVANTSLLLTLTDDELWDVQYGLKLRETNAWYQEAWGRSKRFDKTNKPFPKNALAIIDKAKSTDSVDLVDTRLSDGAVRYLSRENCYTVIDIEYFNLFKQIIAMKQSAYGPETPLLINGTHVLTPVRHETSKWMK